MNFFEGRPVSEDGRFMVDTGSFSVAVPAERKNVYGAYMGKEVVLGLPPQHIHAPDYAPPNIAPATITGMVEVVELLGAELNLFLVTGKQSYTATVDPRLTVSPGNTIDLVADMSHMHLFDKRRNWRFAKMMLVPLGRRKEIFMEKMAG